MNGGESRRDQHLASPDEARDAPVPTRSGPPVKNRRDGAPEGDADHTRLAGRRWAATCYFIAPVGAPFPSVVEGPPGRPDWRGGAMPTARGRISVLKDVRWIALSMPQRRSDANKARRVVLANARTHNLRRREAERRLRHASHRHGVWVPAFAGTTGSFGAATPPNRNRHIAFPLTLSIPLSPA